MRDRLTAFIVTPAPPGTTHGNRITALRWTRRLRELGWHVAVGTAWHGEPCDVLIALHAHKSGGSLARHAHDHPAAPRVLAFTGTDLEDLDDARAREAIACADRFVVLQPRALDLLPPALRARTVVIRQTAVAPPAAPRGAGFLVCAIAHLREVKDPLLAAHAAALVPAPTALRIVHLGGAPDDGWAARARRRARLARPLAVVRR
ncbi:MAG TPA: hypothetical protein VFP84_03985, partial [Kofleriaceae bacterium]|nr:hypothetical protein [Kofleriaceae bacterium]